MKFCLQIHAADNVATLLEDTAADESVGVLGGGSLELREAIPAGHKAALTSIPTGSAVVKYGVPIGLATCDIVPGEWVHLHNCRSAMDERSSAFDVHTGAAGDTAYE